MQRRGLSSLLVLAGCLAAAGSTSFAPDEDERYVPETDPVVVERLEHWQDLKFGLLMHWGPYSQWGVVESWSICSEDEPWCRRSTDNYVEYKKAYEALPRTFNPTKFDPAVWAAAAKAAGMRYVVMTTKHHDGFTMYDTKQTDYRITGPEVPFRTDPRADAFRAVVDAFRGRGFGTGAYFSKPDWHHPDFWAPESTGFKVSAPLANPHPEQAARLTACLRNRYAQQTGLALHNSITNDMTSYHAFSESNENTPAAIIEVGFLNLDRALLTQKPDLLARGITDGIICFLNNENISSETTTPTP